MPGGSFKFKHGAGASGTIINSTVNLSPTDAKVLASGAALSALNALSGGATIAFSQGGTDPVELVYSSLYRDGDVLLTAGAAWTGVADSGYGNVTYDGTNTVWTEDGDPRTMPPPKSSAQGNGVNAIGAPAQRYNPSSSPVGNAAAGTKPRPVLAILEPTNQRLASNITLMFFSYFAGNYGVGPTGVSKVRVYCEGNYVDLTTPQTYVFTDVNGVSRRNNDVYCVTLNVADLVSRHPGGQINIYARAFANDGANTETQLLGQIAATASGYRMQMYSSTIGGGAMRFNIASNGYKYDYLINVDPTAGSNSYTGAAYPGVYATVTDMYAALELRAGHTVTGVPVAPVGNCFEIVCVQNTTWNLGTTTSFTNQAYGQKGYSTIRCAAGKTLTIGYASYVANATWTNNAYGLEFRGNGITFDLTKCPTAAGMGWKLLNAISANGNCFWANGVNFATPGKDFVTNLGPSHDDWNLSFPNDNSSVAYWFWVTECDCQSINGASVPLLRNCYFHDVFNDFANDTQAVYQVTTNRFHKFPLSNLQAHFTLNYSGAGTATYVRSGFGTIVTQFLQLFVDGVQSGSNITITPTTLAGDIVNAVNAIGGGWSATQNNTPGNLDMSTGLADQASIWMGPVSSSQQPVGAGITFTTKNDIHMDWKNWRLGDFNAFIYGCAASDMSGCEVGVADNAYLDFYMINSYWAQGGGSQYTVKAFAHSNFCMINCAVAYGGVDFNNSSGLTLDAYSLFYGNVFDICFADNTIGTSNMAANFKFVNNHTCTNGTDGAGVHYLGNYSSATYTGTTIGNSVATLFPGADAVHPNLEPSSLMNSYMAAPVFTTSLDYIGRTRAASDAKGPKAFRVYSAPSITKQQGIDMMGLTNNAAIASPAGGATLTYSGGQIVYTFNVA